MISTIIEKKRLKAEMIEQAKEKKRFDLEEAKRLAEELGDIFRHGGMHDI